jgi:hypothetical protein
VNKESHSLFCEKGEDFDEGYIIPLYLNVVTCYFATRKATIHEDER